MLLALASLAAPTAARAQSGLGPTPPKPPSSSGSNGSGGSGGHKGSGGSHAQVPAATGGLPHTGLDVPGVALLGLGLMVSGAGLRLRTLDERVF
jgi:hypothetical protein